LLEQEVSGTWKCSAEKPVVRLHRERWLWIGYMCECWLEMRDCCIAADANSETRNQTRTWNEQSQHVTCVQDVFTRFNLSNSLLALLAVRQTHPSAYLKLVEICPRVSQLPTLWSRRPSQAIANVTGNPRVTQRPPAPSPA
jgi:hypothetical protein